MLKKMKEVTIWIFYITFYSNSKSTFVKEFFVSGIFYKKVKTQYQDVECTLFKLLFQQN